MLATRNTEVDAHVQVNASKLRVVNRKHASRKAQYIPGDLRDENSIKKEMQNLLLPRRVFEQYKAWHGAHVLRTETREELSKRKYAVAYYSCPQQAGNRLHAFMNSVLHAIINNRTVLYQYYDTATC